MVFDIHYPLLARGVIAYQNGDSGASAVSIFGEKRSQGVHPLSWRHDIWPTGGKCSCSGLYKKPVMHKVRHVDPYHLHRGRALYFTSETYTRKIVLWLVVVVVIGFWGGLWVSLCMGKGWRQAHPRPAPFISTACAVFCKRTHPQGGRPGQSDEVTSHQLLDQYISAGGNFIDTADVYQHGMSESIIGQYLVKRPELRSKLIIATKVNEHLQCIRAC